MKPFLLTVLFLCSASFAQAGYEVQPTRASTSKSVVDLSRSFVPGGKPCELDTVRVVSYTAPAGRSVLLRDYMWNYIVENAEDINLFRVSKDEQLAQLYIEPSSLQVGLYLVGVQTSDSRLLLESCEYHQ